MYVLDKNEETLEALDNLRDFFYESPKEKDNVSNEEAVELKAIGILLKEVSGRFERVVEARNKRIREEEITKEKVINRFGEGTKFFTNTNWKSVEDLFPNFDNILTTKGWQKFTITVIKSNGLAVIIFSDGTTLTVDPSCIDLENPETEIGKVYNTRCPHPFQDGPDVHEIVVKEVIILPGTHTVYEIKVVGDGVLIPNGIPLTVLE